MEVDLGIDIERALRRAQSRAAKGHADEAAAAYRDILDRFPGNRRAREALAKLGRGADIVAPPDEGPPILPRLRALLDAGRFAEAVAQADGLAAVYPGSVDLFGILAEAQAGLGRNDAALAAAKRALDLAPDRAICWCRLGRILAERGEAETARLAIARALQLDPDMAEAEVALALVLFDGGAEGEALAHLGRALALWTDRPERLLELGQDLARRGALDMAALAAHRATLDDPGLAAAFALLGQVRGARRNWSGAVEALAEAARLAPDDPQIFTALGVARRSQGDVRGALAALDHASVSAPDDPNVLVELGVALQAAGRVEAAAQALRAALTKAPDDAAAHLALGNALVALADPDTAIDHYRRAWDLNPDDASSLLNLSGLVAPSDLDTLAQMVEAAAARGGPDSFVAQVAFATAQLERRRGHPDAAMAALENGARLRKAALGYDHAEAVAQFDLIRASVPSTPGLVKGPPHAPLPVFVVGMPRSGTSLTEQILSSHSAIHGAGELEDLRLAILRNAELGQPLTAGQSTAIRNDYLTALRDIAPQGARFVIDKMPLNFRWIGHIFAALPEARVIHVCRAPEAVCWSNYRLHFASDGMAWSFDQRDVARYWKLYRGLMAHWQRLFPGRITDLVYEDLTEDQDGESRRLIAALGLPWEDAVLNFHQNARAVRTASRLQVRRKMYQGSSEEWRRYEPWLGPMLEELARD